MSREVIELIREMDSEQIEKQLIMQCAPLIVGLRISNLFIVNNGEMRKIRALLMNRPIHYYVLYKDEQKSTILLYNREKLSTYLCEKSCQIFLAKMGYTDFRLLGILWKFRMRYQSYREGQMDFPHELGLILGYPMEDVLGYIENDGKNSLYTGYWKVYYHVAQKRHLFQLFEIAKETLIQLSSNGVGLTEILEVYSGI